MRVTDDRYRGEQGRFELAMRMIGHEARTGTIRYWTGLSDDRIRKLYGTYFKYSDAAVRRRRGKSPTQITPLVETPRRSLESGVLVNLMKGAGLCLCTADTERVLRNNVELGHRFCDCFEVYRQVVQAPSLTFEWGWNLLVNVRRGDEIGVGYCTVCQSCFVRDLLAVPGTPCPVCAVANLGAH